MKKVILLVATISLSGCSTMGAFMSGFSQGYNNSAARNQQVTPAHITPVSCNSFQVGNTVQTNCY